MSTLSKHGRWHLAAIFGTLLLSSLGATRQPTTTPPSRKVRPMDRAALFASPRPGGSNNPGQRTENLTTQPSDA